MEYLEKKLAKLEDRIGIGTHIVRYKVIADDLDAIDMHIDDTDDTEMQHTKLIVYDAVVEDEPEVSEVPMEEPKEPVPTFAERCAMVARDFPEDE